MVVRCTGPLSTCAPDIHLQSVTIPYTVQYSFDLLMMRTTVFHYVLIIRRSKLYYTTSVIITPCRWSSGAQVLSQPVHRTSTYSVTIPYTVQYSFDLLMMRTTVFHYVLIIRRSKLYYTTSGIITSCRCPSGAQVLFQPVHRTATYRCDDTRCFIIQF